MEKKIQLFSGGFDSILQEYLIKPDILLYVDMDTSYSKVEVEFLLSLPDHYLNRLQLIKFPLGRYERDNKYLPYRNLMLGTLAMQYGQHIYFGFNASDDAPDKDDTFLRRMTTLFRHLNQNAIGDMGWDNKNFSFSAPYKNFTKTEMVTKALKAGMSPEFVQNIRSCYDSRSKCGCGMCRPCLNKAVALINNNLFDTNLFDNVVTYKEIDYLYTEVLQRISEGDNLPFMYVDEIKKARILLQQKG